MLFATSVSLIILATLTYAIAHTLLVPKPLPGVPYKRLSSFLPTGELVSLGIHQFLTGEVFSWLSLQCLHLRSPIVQLFIPPFSTTHPVLVISDLREIEDIVTKRMHDVDRADMMYDWFELLVPNATIGMKTGGSWKGQRRLWNVVLGPRFLGEVAAGCFREAGMQLGDLWEEKCDLCGESAFEAGGDVKMATLEGIWKMVVGTELGILVGNRECLRVGEVNRKVGLVKFEKNNEGGFYPSLRTMLTCLDWVAQGISPRMYKWIFRHSPWFLKALEVNDEILGQAIGVARERLQAQGSKEGQEKAELECALTEVLKKNFDLSKRRTNMTRAASDTALRDELLELLITGHETTASSISWALKYLTDNPKVQHRLRSSLYTSFPNASPANIPSTNDLVSASLPYLDAVIAEVLRYSNTGPVSFRQTIRDCDILGYAVPKGTPLILVTAGPSYDSPDMPQVQEHMRSSTSQSKYLRRDYSSRNSFNTNRFIPERWLGEEGSFDPEAVHSLPFSAGPRGCFGKQIALLEMRILISILVMRFQFPQLQVALSKYGAKDGLTRRPTTCFVRPVIVG